MVIILIGALSALGIGLFARSSAFSPLLATQQLQSATLLAQQAALAGNSSRSNVHIRKTSKEFEFIIGATDDPDDPNNTTFFIRREGASMRHSEDGRSSYDGIPADPNSLTITFDSMGRIKSPVAGQNIDFQIRQSSGSIEFHLCLSSLGAVYQGKCDDS